MVNGLFSDDIGLWIGLNDQNKNRQYTWQDSAPLQLTNWAKGQPSYGVRSNGLLLLGVKNNFVTFAQE